MVASHKLQDKDNLLSLKPNNFICIKKFISVLHCCSLEKISGIHGSLVQEQHAQMRVLPKCQTKFKIVSNTVMYICNICFSCARHQTLEAWVNAFRDYKLGSHRCSVYSQLVLKIV